jgi:hypothetical protein
MPTTAKSTPSWRDVLKIHPAAEIFPLMPPDELRALGEDIKKNGLHEAVVLFAEEGGGGIYRETEQLLLDGRNRLDAMEAVGLTTIKEGRLYLMDRFDGGYVVKYRLWKSAVTGFDPYAFVISANIRRRHLTAEQKRELIAKLIKAQPEKSDRQIAETVKASPTTVGTVRREMEGKGEVSKLDTRTDAKGVKQPAHKKDGWSSKRRQTHEAQKRDAADLRALRAEMERQLPRESVAHRENARDDIGPASSGENERLRARNEELECENHRLRLENIALRSEIEELRARLGSPPPNDDGLDIPASLRRVAP